MSDLVDIQLFTIYGLVCTQTTTDVTGAGLEGDQ